MPWLERSLMDQRTQFIADDQRGLQSVTELAVRFGISRKTAYKWIDRYDEGGPGALPDRSRRPHSCAHATDPAIVAAVLEARRHHPRWGAKKLLRILRNKDPQRAWPARRTLCDLLKRHDLIPPRRRRPRLTHPGRPLTPMTAPNVIWTADFKGQFKTRDGRYCYPLTLVDGFSRYLLACQGRHSTAIAPARPVFRRAFEEFGLPTIIRTDNGVPFATTALGRLSLLSVWWIRLGIYPELIEPAHPEQNGRHERMHRTLKAEATRPPSANLQAQQTRFNRFRIEYNEVRPHEALDQATPASIYQPSSRALPRTLPPIAYPAHFEVRLVSRNSGIRWNRRWVCVTHTLAGEYVGLEEVDDGLWDVYFGPLKLGRMDERILRIEDHKGRTVRNSHG
ncbi:MAG: integrase core domain-containing protein [Vicinamibacterales bacterium]